MSTSVKPGSSCEGDTDAVLLSLDKYITTLESAVAHLEIDHEARKHSLELGKSKNISFTEYTAVVDDSMKDTHMLQALQLADKHNKLLLSEDRELKALCAENSQLCNEVMKKQQELEEASETIWKLKNIYCCLVAKKIPLVQEGLRQGNKLPPEEKTELEAKQHKLKVLNNVLLELIISSRVNWAEDNHLSTLSEEASQFI